MDDLPGGSYRTEKISYLEEHLRWCRKIGRSDDTLFRRRQVLTWLAEFLGHDPITATRDELERWQDSLPSLANVRWKTALIRPYYQWLHQRGYRPDNPSALIPLPPNARRLPRPIDEEKLARAIENAPRRLLPWLLLAGWSGMRASDIAQLRRDSFTCDHKGNVWARVIGKGNVERTIPIPGWVWSIINPMMSPSGPCWRRERGFGPVTAQHVSQYSNQYLHKLGFTETLHTLRHRAGTVAMKNTKDLLIVKNLLGHVDIQSTTLYTLVANDDVAAAAENLPRPRSYSDGPHLHVVGEDTH
ncbi:integrase [Longimycelium tulufanense]|uniref:Integrase n=2 Tax=Longimycelium tulufanense TaxID=907463 RepID=A0A8J3FWR3_9PSEU|nr:integrase [Longimycelium tulufanense]